MRTALCMAACLAVVSGGVPAAFAQDSRGLDHGESAGTGIEADDRQTDDERSDGRLSSEARAREAIFVAVPIGRVSVGPGSVDGESIYVRRSAREGMAIVELSTTPFAAEFPGGDGLTVRPDQPAPW